jgi:hypothetical protein
MRVYPSNAAQRETSAYSRRPCSCAKPAVEANLDLSGGRWGFVADNSLASK